MASKRSKKVKKRRKALQRWRQRSASTRRPLTQIPPEHADQVAMTTTGEIMQLIRLHYEVEDVDTLRAIFASLRCLEYDASQRRWVWLYTEEARALPFKDRRAADNVVLGEFVCKSAQDVVLNLRSFERATHAMVFFDSKERENGVTRTGGEDDCQKRPETATTCQETQGATSFSAFGSANFAATSPTV